jgi:hypothetical protein
MDDVRRTDHTQVIAVGNARLVRHLRISAVFADAVDTDRIEAFRDCLTTRAAQNWCGWFTRTAIQTDFHWPAISAASAKEYEAAYPHLSEDERMTKYDDAWVAAEQAKR